jgi:hypothetical protein
MTEEITARVKSTAGVRGAAPTDVPVPAATAAAGDGDADEAAAELEVDALADV